MKIADVPVTRFPFGRTRWILDAALRQRFDSTLHHADAFHIHGLWQEHVSVTAAYAKRVRKPYMISAHGMLERWALKDKWLKKAIYSALIERTNLQGAKCLRALTKAEAVDYRRFGLRVPVAVVPNGVDVPPSANACAFFERFPQLAGKRIVLFLGRIHYKKGLDVLCQAWTRIEKRHRDTQIVIAGSDFGNTRTEIERHAADLGISSRVTFIGLISGDLKWNALAAADAFVLPSHSEGLSIAVLEALGMGVPVVITRACNLPQVEDRQCGWVTSTSADEIGIALDELLNMSSSCRNQMSGRGRQLVHDCFRWQVTGRQMASVYQWVLGGPEPTDTEVC